MNCTRNCKGIRPEVTPELVKASKIITEYYRDFYNKVGCEPGQQCFIRWFNEILRSKEFYEEINKQKE